MERKTDNALELKGRIAMVTGASRGLGKAIAVAFACKGATLIICGRDAEKLHNTKSEIEQFGGSATYMFSCDGTKNNEVGILFDTVMPRLGQLDILVNNIGGVKEYAQFMEITDEQWREVFETNLMTAVRFTRYAIPWLRKSRNGRIINISSVAARQPGSYNPHYGAAKAGLLNLNKHLANYLAPDNILVNAICPGTLYGEVWDENVKNKAQELNIPTETAQQLMEQEVKRKNPLNRVGNFEEVASLAVFLASDKTSYITGDCISVDGGAVRAIF